MEQRPRSRHTVDVDAAGLRAFAAERRDARWLVGMMIRAGAMAAAVAVEHLLYRPDTPANDSFEFATITGGGLEWFAFAHPKRDVDAVNPIVRACGLRIANGIPHVIEGPLASAVVSARPPLPVPPDMAVWRFPLDGRNVCALEYRKGHPMHGTSPGALWQAHMQRQAAVIKRLQDGWRPTLAELERALAGNERGWKGEQ